MIERILLVVAVLAAAFVVLRYVEGRRGRVRGIVPAGLTVVVSEGCRTCTDAIRALDTLRADYRVVDVAEADGFGVSSHTVPYAVMGRADGTVELVRRGRSVVTDADRLASASRMPN